MTQKLDERLNKALKRTRFAWWISLFAFAWFVVAKLPLWCIILILPFGVVSLAVLMYITVHILAFTIPADEIAKAEAENAKEAADKAKLEAVAKIAKRQAAGETIPPDEVLHTLSEAGVVDIAKVTDMGPVIGTYRDNPIYEYILVKMPKRKNDEKMMYHGPANIVEGIPQIPVIDGMIFACVENVLYAYEVPAEQK